MIKQNNFKYFKSKSTQKQAALVIDNNFSIIAFNELFQTQFALAYSKDNNFISVLKNMNKIVWHNKQLPKELTIQIIEHQDALIEKIFIVSRDYKTPIPFAYFIFQNNEFRSKLLQIIPQFDSVAKLYGLQIIISEFTAWKSYNYSDDVMPPTSKQIAKLIDINHQPPIKLNEQHYLILISLALGISVRNTAKSLGLSYGNIAKTIRETIAPRFDIYDGDTDKLILKAKELGYHNLVAQTLCRPFIRVLDDLIISKYGLE